MIRTKIAFLTFSILLVSLFPFSFNLTESGFATPIIPGRHVTVISSYLISAFIKFIILIFIVLGYWKILKMKNVISSKLFYIHLFLTIPSIVSSKISLLSLIDYNANDLEKLVNEIESVSILIIVMNVMFLLGQIIFGIYYFRIRNKVIVDEDYKNL